MVDEYSQSGSPITTEILKFSDKGIETFEVCGQASNTNEFTNKTVALQRAGMNVSCATPPVTNKTSSKELIKITGYTQNN